MPVLILSRERPLDPAEEARLPPGCAKVVGMKDVIVRADVSLPQAGLLAFVAKLARAVPDAELAVLEGNKKLATASPVSGAQPLSPQDSERRQAEGDGQADPAPVAPQAAPADPWFFVDSGNTAEAERLFAEIRDLGSQGRDRVRLLANSTNPEDVALACRVAGMTGWKSFAQTARRHLGHADTRVRRDAATAIGLLAGVSLVPALRSLLTDASPEVVEAAKAAIERIEG